jgi:hypothetical protein
MATIEAVPVVATVDESVAELETLFPDNKVFGYEIKRYKFKDFKTILCLVEQYPEVLQGDITKLLSSKAINDLELFILLSLDISSEELGEIHDAQIIQLLRAIIEVNISFFVRSLNTASVELAAAMKAQKEAGEKSPQS